MILQICKYVIMTITIMRTKIDKSGTLSVKNRSSPILRHHFRILTGLFHSLVTRNGYNRVPRHNGGINQSELCLLSPPRQVPTPESRIGILAWVHAKYMKSHLPFSFSVSYFWICNLSKSPYASNYMRSSEVISKRRLRRIENGSVHSRSRDCSRSCRSCIP